MRICSQKSVWLVVAIAIAIASQPSRSGAIQLNSTVSDAWSTTHFGDSDLPCLPIQKQKTFNVSLKNTSDNAYMMMAASYLAYSFWPGKRKRILTSWGFSNINLFDHSPSSTNGYWAEHNSFVLLAIRGTQEPTDLLTDISVNLEQLEESAKDVLVHSGFKRGADAVWNHVEAAARVAQRRGKPLFVTGHSLGGAVALLSAVKLEKHNLPLQALWTFGAPKVGNNSFFQSAQSLLNEKWQRINQETDPIPALPFTDEDEYRLREWSTSWGRFVPVLEKFAENSKYDTAPIVFREDLPDLTKTPITRRRLTDIGLGFLKHLPRSYVCDLSKEKLKL
jgi:hypothetical protein